MMNRGLRRRRFLQMASALGLGAELAPWASLRTITPLKGEEAQLKPEMVKFRPEIEPVVRLIEDTPRDRALEMAITQLKKGLSYNQLLSGLFLAGIRNIKPRPVGFKFHAVMVINSAHVLGQSSAVTERLLPLLWALDNFKSSQAQDVKEGDWVLAEVDECRLPKTHRAKEEFVRAMEVWDPEAADAAIAALCRSSGAAETMEPLWRIAVRDQRNIGHKAIFAAQSWRTLQTIGWVHAEPVLRSLVFGMLDLQGDSRPRPVGPYEANLEIAPKIREEWTDRPRRSRSNAGVASGYPTGHTRSSLCRGRQVAQPGDFPRFALGCRDPGRVRALDAQPRHPGTSRHDGYKRTPLHLYSKRRRYDSPARFAPGSRVAADVSRTCQAHRRDRHRLAQSQPGRAALEWRRGCRRNLRDDQRRPQESRCQSDGLSGPRWLAGSHLRRRPAHDLPQGPRQP